MLAASITSYAMKDATRDHIMTAMPQALDAAAMLAIPQAEPERLFSAADAIAATFRTLARRWHPDRNADPQASHVFAHLAALRAEALRRRDAGLWRGPAVVAFESRDGRLYELRYRRLHEDAVASLYVGKAVLAEAFALDCDDLARNAARRIAGLRFRDAASRAAFGPRLPDLAATIERRDGLVLVQRKTPGEIPLADLLDLCGGRLDPRHVAWIVSDLLATACFLDLPDNDLVLPVLARAGVLIDSAGHAARIAGGWGFAARKGARLAALPEPVVAALPPVLLRERVAVAPLMLEAIRRLAAHALGAATTLAARRRADLPKAFGDWLVSPAPARALNDYRGWSVALDASFGPRRFLDLKLDPHPIPAQP